MSKKLFKSTSYSFLSMISLMGWNFIAFLILIRELSEYEFGTWVLFLSLTSFTEMARNGLIQNGLVKFMAANPSEEKVIGKAGLGLTIIASLISSAVLFLIGFVLSNIWNTPELIYFLGSYFIYSLIYGTLKFMEFFQIGKQEFSGVFYGNFIYGFVFVSGILGMNFLNPEMLFLNLIWLQVLAAIIAILVVFIVKRKLLTFTKPLRFSKRNSQKESVSNWTKKLFNFGKYVFGTNFSSMLFNKTDVLMLGTFLNPAAVAIYSLATRISGYLEIPVNAIAQVIFPKIAEQSQVKDKSSIIKLYEQSVGLLLLIILPMSAMVFFFAEPIILLVSGGKYLEAVPVLQIFLIAGIIKPWGRLFGITLDAIGLPKINFKMLVFSLIVNIIFNLIFIPIFGILGAAFATTISIWTTIILGQFYLSNILQVNHLRIFKHIFSLLLSRQTYSVGSTSN